MPAPTGDSGEGAGESQMGTSPAGPESGIDGGGNCL